MSQDEEIPIKENKTARKRKYKVRMAMVIWKKFEKYSNSCCLSVVYIV